MELSEKDKIYIIRLVLDFNVSQHVAQKAFLMGGTLHSDILCQFMIMDVPEETLHAINAQLWLEYHKTKALCKKMHIPFNEKSFKSTILDTSNQYLRKLPRQGN